MRQIRLPAVVVAIALQLFPIARTASLSPAVSSTFAIILRWAVGGAAAFEAYDACSGASALFTFPTNATATVGQNFKFFITITNIGTDPGATFAVSPLPTGLSVSNYDKPPVHGVLYGIPQKATNSMKLRVAASYPGQPSISTNLYLTILPAATETAPQITTQPVATNVVAGMPATFAVAASGNSLVYQWQKGGAKLSGATTSSLTINPAHTTDAADYSVVITNSGGSVTSTAAHLSVSLPPSPVLTVVSPPGNAFQFSFTPATGLTNTIYVTSDLGNGLWTTLTNIPPPLSATPITVSDPVVGDRRLYRVGIQP